MELAENSFEHTLADIFENQTVGILENWRISDTTNVLIYIEPGNREESLRH